MWFLQLYRHLPETVFPFTDAHNFNTELGAYTRSDTDNFSSVYSGTENCAGLIFPQICWCAKDHAGFLPGVTRNHKGLWSCFLFPFSLFISLFISLFKIASPPSAEFLSPLPGAHGYQYSSTLTLTFTLKVTEQNGAKSETQPWSRPKRRKSGFFVTPAWRPLIPIYSNPDLYLDPQGHGEKWRQKWNSALESSQKAQVRIFCHPCLAPIDTHILQPWPLSWPSRSRRKMAPKVKLSPGVVPKGASADFLSPLPGAYWYPYTPTLTFILTLKVMEKNGAKSETQPLSRPKRGKCGVFVTPAWRPLIFIYSNPDLHHTPQGHGEKWRQKWNSALESSQKGWVSLWRHFSPWPLRVKIKVRVGVYGYQWAPGRGDNKSGLGGLAILNKEMNKEMNKEKGKRKQLHRPESQVIPERWAGMIRVAIREWVKAPFRNLKNVHLGLKKKWPWCCAPENHGMIRVAICECMKAP